MKTKTVAQTLAMVSAMVLALGISTAVFSQDTKAPAKTQAKGPIPARLPNGKPNWTGFWIPPGGLVDVYRGPSGLEGVPLGTNFLARRDPTMPEMKSPYKEQYEKAREDVQKGPLPDKVALCYPTGMPHMMVMIYGMEILQTPNIIAISSEWQAMTRRVWMDLKEHPPADELDETYAGHSIGHWEGDVLVVDTVGIRTDVPLEHQIPINHSDKLHIVEHWRQTAPDMLEDEVTVIDPDVFVKPWVKKYTYRYKPGLQIKEYVCLDNNRNVDEEGRQKF